MRSRHAAGGSFDFSFADLLPLLAVQPHQLSAARSPAEPIRNIVGEGRSPESDLEQLVNDRLCGCGRH